MCGCMKLYDLQIEGVNEDVIREIVTKPISAHSLFSNIDEWRNGYKQ